MSHEVQDSNKESETEPFPTSMVYQGVHVNQLGSRIDALHDLIHEQNATIDQLRNQIKSLNETRYLNEINIDFMETTETTEDLQAQVENTNILESHHTVEFNNETIPQQLLSPEHVNEFNSSDNSNIILDAINFDIPTFFCCFFNIIYASLACTVLLMKFELPMLGYLAGIAQAFSLVFEMFSERLNGKIQNFLFMLNATGGIVLWVTLTTFKEGLIYFSVGSSPYISSLTGGIMMIVSEIIILFQMKVEEMPSMLIFSHACKLFMIALLFLYKQPVTEVFLVIFSLLSLIFLLSGLPVHHFISSKEEATNQNSHDNNQQETGQQNDMRNSVHDNNDENFQESSTNTNHIHRLTDILRQHQEQLESLEAQIQKPINHFTYSNLRPKGLNENWTTRAKLSPDVYTMMMLSNWRNLTFCHPCNSCKKYFTYVIIPRPSKSWMLGLTVFTVQTLLAFVTLFDQQSTEFGDTLMNIPVRGTTKSYTVQFFTLILAVMTQTDILVSFRIVLLLSYGKDTWLELISHDRNERDFSTWLGHILLPNVLKSFQAFIVLVTTFFVILQSESVVELLKDFTALFVISSIDDMFFFLADHGYLGSDLSKRTNKSKKISIEEDDRKIQSILKLFFFTILLIMFGGWIAVVILQKNNFFINQKYPNCPNDVDFSCIDNGVCDFSRGIGPNILECGWEGGDCTTINERYPDCDFETSSLFADGKCDRISNLEECGYDGGDCLEFNEKYPNCTVVYPSLVGDGRCNDECNTEECGWDGGDCIVLNMVHLKNYPNCKGVNPLRVGDKICDSGTYNTAECGYDGGDCLDFNYKYPSCIVRYPQFVGNTVCNGDEYNTTECGWDGGDCLI